MANGLPGQHGRIGPSHSDEASDLVSNWLRLFGTWESGLDGLGLGWPLET